MSGPHAFPLLLALLCSGCTCSSRNVDPVDLHRDDGPAAAAVLPATTTYCLPACQAAAQVDCQRLFDKLCHDDTAAFVKVGGYVLPCADALKAACAGGNVGVPACVSSCTAGHVDPSGCSPEPSSGAPGDSCGEP